METLTTVITFILDQFSTMTTTLMSNNLFLIAVAVFVCGSVIGLVTRLMRH